MKRERILSLLGYDKALLRQLSASDCSSLRGAGVAWLVACLILGLAAGYSAGLVLPGRFSAVVGGVGVGLLTLNLLRVVTAGGGSRRLGTLEQDEAACRSFRPSLIPAIVFGVLAAILAQPAQIPFWPDLEPQVEAHRQALIEQHEVAATRLSTEADYYSEELQAAGFPIFRLKLIWKDPKRAVRLTFIICLLVLLPAFWSQVFSIEGIRAYELERCRRTHGAKDSLESEGRAEVDAILRQWPNYRPRRSPS